MRKLNDHEIEEIAMQYVKLNSSNGDSVDRLYDLYSAAVEQLGKIESEIAERNISSYNWSL